MMNDTIPVKENDFYTNVIQINVTSSATVQEDSQEHQPEGIHTL